MGAVDQAVSLSTAKAHLAGLVQAAETGEVVHISRHGKPVAVLISEQAYATLQGHQSRRDVWTAIADWRAAAHGRHADDRSTGREVQLGLPGASSNNSTAICRGC